MIIISSFLKKYDVAFSFAEEDRAFVERVVRLLQEQKVNVFYDDDARIDSWGADLGHYLDLVYRRQARFCVTFISQYYVQKSWTRFEAERANAMAFFQKNKAYVLPYRMDDTPFDSIPASVAYLSWRTHDEKQLARAIVEKLGRLPWYLLRSKDRKLARNGFKGVMLSLATPVVFASGIVDNLTPVDTLTKRLYERSRKTIKVICEDGTVSFKTGSGACSHHGGIAHKADSTIYTKTLEECRDEARKTSWFSQ